MRKFNMFFSAMQFAALAELAKKTGLSVAEHVRRAIDAYLKKAGK